MDGAEIAPTATPVNQRGFFNPYMQIAVGAVLVTASELLLKKGASASPGGSFFGIEPLASLWTWAGIVTYILSFASWLYVLRLVPLGIAFSLINVVHVLVPLGSWVLLGEAVTLKRWAGIALVFSGIILIARDTAKVEEKL